MEALPIDETVTTLDRFLQTYGFASTMWLISAIGVLLLLLILLFTARRSFSGVDSNAKIALTQNEAMLRSQSDMQARLIRLEEELKAERHMRQQLEKEVAHLKNAMKQQEQENLAEIILWKKRAREAGYLYLNERKLTAKLQAELKSKGAIG